MKEYTQKELLDIYEKLPQEVKDAIFSIDSATMIQKIAKNYKLTVDKMGELADETGLVMLGLTHPRDYISNLSRRLEINKETAKKIAEEINTQIFSKIRESLKRIHNIREETPLGEEVKRPDVPQIVPKPAFGTETKTEPTIPGAEKIELIKEIEKDELGEKTEPKTEIEKTETKAPSAVPETPKEFHRAPMQESNHTGEQKEMETKRYQQGDPYREPLE